jgi:hypothetical protein
MISSNVALFTVQHEKEKTVVYRSTSNKYRIRCETMLMAISEATEKTQLFDTVKTTEMMEKYYSDHDHFCTSLISKNASCLQHNYIKKTSVAVRRTD